MARRPGELTISETANLLEVHEQTVRRWAREARAGRPSRINDVRVDLVGRYWIDGGELRRLSLRESDFT